jgi:hypothetical protein
VCVPGALVIEKIDASCTKQAIAPAASASKRFGSLFLRTINLPKKKGKNMRLLTPVKKDTIK